MFPTTTKRDGRRFSGVARVSSALVVLLLLALCAGSGASLADDGKSESDSKLLRKYQPALVFHPDELFRPMKVQRFVEDSQLERFVGSSPQQLPLDAVLDRRRSRPGARRAPGSGIRCLLPARPDRL